MKISSVSLVFSVSVAAILSLSTISPGVAAESAPPTNPAIRAIENSAPGFIPPANVRRSADLTTSQARARGGNASNELPTNSGDPVAVQSSSGTVIRFGLPFNEKAVEGKKQSNGTVVFDNENGTSTVLVPKEGRSVAAVIVLSSNSSPTRFNYNLSVPLGGTATLNSRGSVEIFDAKGDFSGVIAPAWAKDSSGKVVATHYELNGPTLTQVVDHTSQSYAYPIVADPWLGIDLIDRFSWDGNNIKVHVTPMMGFVNEAVAAGPGWDELKTKTRNRVNQATLHQQWVCHALGKFVIFFEPPPNNTWDLEGWRRVVTNPVDFITYRCNW
ncbi:DUF2599 domain-containing protein [Arthrobacter sp. efr-133-TYG-118]|uniref:DUF2599 domain-containing protein n=1 Tax=Arthrobacter sp. efr-133-TYG-118 TaxID=3040279 RepID=UPI00254A97D4|nr:DUF2599 domain-containing protein [Arthrobacter sp. efr-133-TYG-118]